MENPHVTDNGGIKIREALKGVSLFTDVAPVQLEILAHGSRRLHLEKFQTIFRAGANANEMYCLLAGHVKRVAWPYNSNEKILDLLYPGQTFGEAELLSARPHASFAVTIEPSTLLVIDGACLQQAIAADAQLAGKLLAGLARRQMDMETDLIASRTLSGSQRILDYFMLQSGGLTGTRGETTLVLPTSKQLIASRLGITPETLSRGLRELSDAGLIVVEGKYILLQNAPIRHIMTRMTTTPDRWVHTPDANGPEKLWKQWNLREPVEQSGNNTQYHCTEAPSGAAHAHDSNHMRMLHAATNKAGRLRMLSQRMAKSWLMLGRNVLPLRATSILKQSIEAFDKQLMELASIQYHKEIRSAQAAVHASWYLYRELLESKPVASDAKQLFKLNEQVLLATHRLTQAFEQAANTPESQLINLAGRERMLPQRMAKFYMFLEWEKSGISSKKCHEELHHAMHEFETGLTRLVEEVRDQPQISAQLALVTRQWHHMRSALTLDGNQNTGQLTATVCTFSERLLKKMDAAIALYEKNLAA